MKKPLSRLPEKRLWKSNALHKTHVSRQVGQARYAETSTCCLKNSIDSIPQTRGFVKQILHAVFQGVQADAVHEHAALHATETLCLTFGGLSKVQRVAGYRSGWVVITGPKQIASDFIEGITLLANMRMCANVPGQQAIQTALGGYQSINELIVPGGRFYDQSKLAWKLLNKIPGVSCVEPQGALYVFPRLDPEVYDIPDDQAFVIELLRAKKILVTHGTGFNWPYTDHFRLVALPDTAMLTEAIGRIASFLETQRG